MRAVPWFPFGPDGGDARAFGADPKDHAHIYLGTATGWIYQTHNEGKKWERLAQVGKRDDLILDNIIVDAAEPKHLVVGAHVSGNFNDPDGGIYVSNDSGRTWTTTPEMRGQSVLALAQAPSEPKIFVAGSFSGVFRSIDSGTHWARISRDEDKELHEVESIAIDPGAPATIYAGTWHLPWKTTDGGKTWAPIKQGIIEDSDVFSIIVDPKEPKVVYLSACSGIYKSMDGGATFIGGTAKNKSQGIPTSARRTRVLMQDPDHLATVFAGTTEGLYRTDDNGKYWTQTTGPEIIVNDVYVDPSDSKHVLLATDRGGVLASDDGGSSFLPSNPGFSARLITAYAADAKHPATVYVGVVNDKEWGGVFVSHTGGLSWSQLSAGLDGRDVFSLGQAPDGSVLAGTNHGIYRLKDVVWQRVPEGVGPGVGGKLAAKAKPAARGTTGIGTTKAKAGNAAALKSFNGSVYGFASAGETLYAATSQGLLRSPSNGLTWTATEALPAVECRFVAAAKANVTAASLDALQLSSDGGSTWQSLKLPAKVTQLKALAVDAQGAVWVGGREGAFVSSDKGATWQTPVGLYVKNVNSLYFDEAANRMLVTSDGPATMAFAVTLPALQVSSWDTGWNLRFVRPVGDHLVAATLFDGFVVQPRMVALPDPGAATAQR